VREGEPGDRQSKRAAIAGGPHELYGQLRSPDRGFASAPALVEVGDQDEGCPVKITTIPKPFTSAETSLDIGSPPLRWLNMSANMGRFAQQRKGFSKLPHSGPTRDAWLWDYK